MTLLSICLIVVGITVCECFLLPPGFPKYEDIRGHGAKYYDDLMLKFFTEEEKAANGLRQNVTDGKNPPDHNPNGLDKRKEDKDIKALPGQKNSSTLVLKENKNGTTKKPNGKDVSTTENIPKKVTPVQEGVTMVTRPDQSVQGDNTTETDPSEVGLESSTIESDPREVLLETRTTESDPGELVLESNTTESDPGEVVLESSTTESDPGEVVLKSSTTESDPGELVLENSTIESDPREVVLETRTTESDPGKGLLKSSTTETDPKEGVLESSTTETDPKEDALESSTTETDPKEAVLGSSTTEKVLRESTQDNYIENYQRENVQDITTVGNRVEKSVHNSYTTKRNPVRAVAVSVERDPWKSAEFLHTISKNVHREIVQYSGTGKMGRGESEQDSYTTESGLGFLDGDNVMAEKILEMGAQQGSTAQKVPEKNVLNAQNWQEEVGQDSSADDGVGESAAENERVTGDVTKEDERGDTKNNEFIQSPKAGGSKHAGNKWSKLVKNANYYLNEPEYVPAAGARHNEMKANTVKTDAAHKKIIRDKLPYNLKINTAPKNTAQVYTFTSAKRPVRDRVTDCKPGNNVNCKAVMNVPRQGIGAGNKVIKEKPPNKNREIKTNNSTTKNKPKVVKTYSKPLQTRFQTHGKKWTDAKSQWPIRKPYFNKESIALNCDKGGPGLINDCDALKKVIGFGTENKAENNTDSFETLPTVPDQDPGSWRRPSKPPIYSPFLPSKADIGFTINAMGEAFGTLGKIMFGKL